MTVADKRQYPSSSPGTDGQVIPIEVSRPELLFSLCFTNTPMISPILLDPTWDILELWSNEVCLVGFNTTSVIRPDGAGTPVPLTYLIGATALDSPDRIVLTPPGWDTTDPQNPDRRLSVIGLSNPGELFISVLTRMEAISIDVLLNRG